MTCFLASFSFKFQPTPPQLLWQLGQPFPVEKKGGNTRGGIRLRHPKKHFCSLKFRGTAGFNDPTSWIIHDGGIATWLYQQLT